MEVSIIAGAAAFAGAVIALAVYHFALVRPAPQQAAAVLTTHDDLLGDGKIRATHRRSSLEEGHEELVRRAERADSRLRELDALSQTDVSELSYAIALPNREGNGVVLTSIDRARNGN